MAAAIITRVTCPRCGAVIGSRCVTSTGALFHNGTHAQRISDYQNTMRRAFQLVNPAVHAQELARRGIVSQEAADKQDWKGEIAIAITLETIESAGLTIAQIEDSIPFMTATRAQILPADIAGEPWVCYLGSRPGFLILADGYRKGPAGP